MSEIVEDSFYEDNEGADVIEILDHGDGTYTFQVGNCCVWILRKTGTISEITNWLAGITFNLPNDMIVMDN